jgi:signal peptidase
MTQISPNLGENKKKNEDAKEKKKINKKDIIVGLLIIGIAFFGTFGVYGIMKITLRTEYPMVVVISGSMEPTIYRGDLLIVEGVAPEDLKVGTIEDKKGDIIVFDSQGVWPGGGKEPIVHRIVGRYIDNATGKYYFITKGDNNPDTDPPGPGEVLLPAEKILGRVVSIIPKVGYVRIFLSEGNVGYYIIGLLGVILVVSIVKDILNPEEDEEEKEKKIKEHKERVLKKETGKDTEPTKKYDMGV